jgi:adenine-specific DNA methylase
MKSHIDNEQLQFDFMNGITTVPLTYRSKERCNLSLRPIHYLGSKLRIVDSIREIVDLVEPSGGPVCDLFAGSGTVSREFSALRTVVSVDIQEYSRVLCSALLKPAILSEEDIAQYLDTAFESEHANRLLWAIEPMISYEENCREQAESGNDEPLCQLLEQASIILFQLEREYFKDPILYAAMSETVSRLKTVDLLESVSSLATRYFGGIYFSFIQASKIDMLLEGISLLPITQKDTYLAAVLSVTSEIVNTVGKQFAQPIRPRFSDGRVKPNLAQRVARDRTIDVVSVFKNWITRYIETQHSDRKHQIIRSDFTDALDGLTGQVSVVYADPPYTRDHYSRYYHVLETLCVRDCPSVSSVQINGVNRISRGIYRSDRYQSPFSIKSKTPSAFINLFTKVRRLDVPLVLSYSPFEKGTGARPRLMVIEDIVRLASKSFRFVEVQSAGYFAHSKLNRSDLNKAITYDAETFIICKP